MENVPKPPREDAMAADGKPDRAAIQCGQEIGRLRVNRGWTRMQLVSRAWNEFQSAGLDFNSISESWLARLEQGRTVKISRPELDALIRALKCTEQEQARLLLYADRNTLNNSLDEPSPVAEVFNYGMVTIATGAQEILSTLIGQRRAQDLSREEQLELFATAIEMVLNDFRG